MKLFLSILSWSLFTIGNWHISFASEKFDISLLNKEQHELTYKQNKDRGRVLYSFKQDDGKYQELFEWDRSWMINEPTPGVTGYCTKAKMEDYVLLIKRHFSPKMIEQLSNSNVNVQMWPVIRNNGKVIRIQQFDIYSDQKLDMKTLNKLMKKLNKAFIKHVEFEDGEEMIRSGVPYYTPPAQIVMMFSNDGIWMDSMHRSVYDWGEEILKLWEERMGTNYHLDKYFKSF